MLISNGGTVIRMPVDGIRRAGRSTQGVIVMRLRGDEQISTLAPVVEQTDGELTELEADDAPMQTDDALEAEAEVVAGADGDVPTEDA